MSAPIAFALAVTIALAIVASTRGRGAVMERDVGLDVASSAVATLGFHARALLPLAAILACVTIVALIVRRRRFADMQPRRPTAFLVAGLAALLLAAAVFARRVEAPPVGCVDVDVEHGVRCILTPRSLPSVPLAFEALGVLALALSLGGIVATLRRTRVETGGAPYRGASLSVVAVGPRGVAPATAAALVLLAPLAIAVTERLAVYGFG